MSHSALTPPAQLTYNIPSFSESILISLFAVISEVSRSLAPSIPISSSLVSTACIGGCAIVSDASTASINATAIPSSAPSVVPSAHTILPSVQALMLCTLMSISQSGSFSHTISRCPCKITGSQSSYPEEPALNITTLSDVSFLALSPCNLANSRQ